MSTRWQCKLTVRQIGTMVALVLAWSHGVFAEDPTKPTFRSYAGAFLAGDDHNFFIESEVRLPLVSEELWGLYYRHHDATPFLDVDDRVQAELLYNRDELQADFRLNDFLRLISIGGYQKSQRSDRSGKVSGFVYGVGFAAMIPTGWERLYWRLVGGGYLDRRDLTSDWWLDIEASWRLFYFIREEYLENHYRASLAIAADAQTSNQGDRIRPFVRLGPQLQLLTAHGNRANLQLQWYYQDDNPFYGEKENGFLIGLDVFSSGTNNYEVDLREDRPQGWLPVIWGAYDVGIGHDQRVTRFEINAELFDFVLANRRYTLNTWYETHQEQRIGDYDNISYSVALGLQTPLELESVLSHGDPLLLGLDFVHRSDHALNASADRVAAVGEPRAIGPLINNGSINLLPRVRLQSVGWDLPYRDPTIYDRDCSEWLHLFDWRVAAGYTISSTRNRSDWAAQLGLSWDVAAVHGHVVYLRALASFGEEIPDWVCEAGLRRPIGKLFLRWEDYGINRNIARDDIFMIGLGVHL